MIGPYTREELVKFCEESSEYFETHTEIDYDNISDKELNYYVDFFDYLWEK